MRMTPAKAMAMLDKRMDNLDIQERPIAQLACMFWNAKMRDPGDSSKGIPPADEKSVDEFRIYKRGKRTTLAAKDGPGGRHNLDGAKTDVGAWMAYVKGKQPKVRVKK